MRNPNLKMETVWSYAAGFETAALRYLWLKTMFFQHDMNDVLSNEPLPGGLFTYVNKGKQRRRGVETEIKTMPVYNTSLLAGYSFVDARDRVTGEEINAAPKYTFDMGIQYDDKKSFQGTLKGHYIRWHFEPPDTGRFNAMTLGPQPGEKGFYRRKQDCRVVFFLPQYLQQRPVFVSFQEPRPLV